MNPERRLSHPIGISHSPKNRPPAFHVAALRSYSIRDWLADVGPPRSATWSAVAENAVATSTTTEFTGRLLVIEHTRALTRSRPPANPATTRTCPHPGQAEPPEVSR